MKKITKENGIKYRLLSFFLISSIYFSEIVFTAGSDEIEQSESNSGVLFSFITTELFLNVFFALITIICTFALAKFSSSRMSQHLENSYAGEEAGREELVGVVSRTINITILSIGFALTLTILGIDMGIFLGGLGFGIGFTLKIFLTNFIAGILMVTQGFYHLGDVVQVGGKIGKIIHIHALFTAIEQFDGVVYYVPNVKFLEDEVSNYHSNDKRRIDVNVGVDYNTDLVKAKKIMLQVVGQFPNILKAPGADILIEGMGDSSIKLSLRFWIDSKDSFFESQSNVTETVNMAFKQAGIVIPFPQITLSNRSDFKIALDN